MTNFFYNNYLDKLIAIFSNIDIALSMGKLTVRFIELIKLVIK